VYARWHGPTAESQADTTQKIPPMRWGAVGAGICIAVAPAPASSARSPVIESFQLEPARLCHGDPVRYRLSYTRLAGGLAAVKEAELAASPPRPGMAPLDLGILRPDRDELARHRQWETKGRTNNS
jgi:hypothetical protein